MLEGRANYLACSQRKYSIWRLNSTAEVQPRDHERRPELHLKLGESIALFDVHMNLNLDLARLPIPISRTRFLQAMIHPVVWHVCMMECISYGTRYMDGGEEGKQEGYSVDKCEPITIIASQTERNKMIKTTHESEGRALGLLLTTELEAVTYIKYNVR